MVAKEGESEEEMRKKKVDGSVGELVWVRRKNGSWWPGQILGLDDVALCVEGEGERSGVPIKLLARDDTSVEWHDLETTKIVKAFHCGDYDSCIEKAKVTAAKSSRRKYAYPRREEAIIRALEIERDRLINECPYVNSPDSEPLCNGVKASTSISSTSKDSDYSSGETNSEETGSAFSHSGISYEETTLLKGRALRARRKTPYDSEDDGSDGIKRMKGLDDLGVGGHKRVPILALANLVPQSSPSLNNLHATNGTTSVGALVNGGSKPTLKRKRSQVIHIHELLKRKYRHRPLTKVLENTTMVPVQIICDVFANPFERSDSTPGSICENGKKRKDAQILTAQFSDDGSSGLLFDVPFIDEELDVTDSSPVWRPPSSLKTHISGFKVPSSSNFRLEELNESGPSHSPVNRKMEKSASKWQSKGKRKARHVSKCEDQNSIKKAGIDKEKSEDFMLENSSRIASSSNGLVNGFRDRRKHISLSASQRAFPYQPRFLVHGDYEIPDAHPRGMYMGSSLYEVEITVEATRPQGHQVPYISLLSKLNGKPITGHPVIVEVVQNGYCDMHISDYPASGNCELDDKDIEQDLLPTSELKARRKERKARNMQISDYLARGNCELDDKDIEQNLLPTSELKARRKERKARNMQLSDYPARGNCELDDKDIEQNLLPTSELKARRKELKARKKKRRKIQFTNPRKRSSKSKRHGSFSKKTRKLSSLTALHKKHPEKRVVQNSNGPTLSCVPLKVVFSRINEALNTFTRSAHRTVALNNT